MNSENPQTAEVVSLHRLLSMLFQWLLQPPQLLFWSLSSVVAVAYDHLCPLLLEVLRNGKEQRSCLHHSHKKYEAPTEAGPDQFTRSLLLAPISSERSKCSFMNSIGRREHNSWIHYRLVGLACLFIVECCPKPTASLVRGFHSPRVNNNKNDNIHDDGPTLHQIFYYDGPVYVT